jgi:hypothetical protein
MSTMKMRMRGICGVLLGAVLPVLAGCRQAAPVLEVGRIAYFAEEVAGRDSAELVLLADITALGLAIADQTVEEVGAPVVEQLSERTRLNIMPLFLGAQRMGLGEEQLQQAYLQEPEWELEVRHLVRLAPRAATAEDRRQARQLAEQARRRAEAGEDFAELSAEYSEEPGAAARGGLLQPGRQGDWVAPFWEAAGQLQPGETSPVVETEYGYHVLRLEERRVVPFEEADHARLLSRVVPAATAMEAMEEWVGGAAPVYTVDPPAVLAARRQLRAGIISDTLVIGSGPDWSYTDRTLALARAGADSDVRQRLLRADDFDFGRWVENDVREHAWVEAARAMGGPRPRAAETAANREWMRRVHTLGAAFGLRPGMNDATLKSVALRALGATGQEVGIARLELPALRPLLRERYPVTGGSPTAD